ncbi:MAG: hypothetical protein ACXVRH_10710 [Thermoleophilaceae bacterium]
MTSDDDRRSTVERRIARSQVDDSGVGKPLSRRARHTRRSVEAYIAAGVIPRYMERLKEIEAERARLRRQIGRAHRRLSEACGDDREAFASAWRERAERWNFQPINQLIHEHNEWYPMESGLPLNPRTGYYVMLRGRSYRREPLGPEWVLEQFPDD